MSSHLVDESLRFNWSKCDEDILEQIIKKLKLYKDFTIFRCVCRSWYQAAPIRSFKFWLDQIPWLMLPFKNEDTDLDLRGFYSHPSGEFRHLSLPQFKHHRTLSSQGWLINIDEKFNMNLFEPFSSSLIELPNISSLCDLPPPSLHNKPLPPFVQNGRIINVQNGHISNLKRCALSPNPSPSNYTLLVVCGKFGNLAFCKPGFKSWIKIPSTRGNYLDIIYYKNKFYAIDAMGQLVMVDIKSDDTVETRVLALKDVCFEDSSRIMYLVEFKGKLLAVLQNRVGDETDSFKVFEIDIDFSSNINVIELHLFSSSHVWKEVTSLGDGAIFVGHNSSFSIPSLDGKGNCIYFNENLDFFKFLEGIREETADMGIYYLEDGRVEPHYGNSAYYINPPLWIEKV